MLVRGRGEGLYNQKPPFLTALYTFKLEMEGVMPCDAEIRIRQGVSFGRSICLRRKAAGEGSDSSADKFPVAFLNTCEFATTPEKPLGT